MVLIVHCILILQSVILFGCTIGDQRPYRNGCARRCTPHRIHGGRGTSHRTETPHVSNAAAVPPGRKW
jgi:hypothetical protein